MATLTENDPEFVVNENALEESVAKQEENQAGLAVKVLTIFGGFLATNSFIAFCIAAGLYDSAGGLLVFGIVFIVISILLDRFYDRLIIDTFSVTMFASGLALAGWGTGALDSDLNLIPLSYIGVGIIIVFVARSFILTFLSILLINGSIITLMLMNSYYDLVHLYNTICTLLVTYLFLNEAKAISMNNRFTELYGPFRIGLVFSLLFGLIVLGKKGFIPVSENLVWLSSIVMFAAVLYMVTKILNIMSVMAVRMKLLVLIASGLILLSTVFSPAIAGAILILLLSFKVNYRTGMAIGVIALVYFISQYYYDLNFSLLTKSIMLMSSGSLFLLLYFFTSKKIDSNEEL